MVIVKVCKNHGELTVNEVYVCYSKHGDKQYQYYSCKVCISDKRKRLYGADKEKYQKYALMMREKHYEKCLERDRKYKRNLLINESQYQELNIKQNGLCAICNNPEQSKSHKNRTKSLEEEKISIKRLAIDHCHQTGKVRGLLCHSCNTALGLFKDSMENLNSAIAYLLSSQD